MLPARSVAQKLRLLCEGLSLSGRILRSLAVALFAGGGVTAVAVEATSILRGDLNRDGVVNYDDMEAFVQAVNDPAAWRARFGADEATRREAGDFSRDGVVDSADVRGFSAAIIVGEQQSRRAPAKPEAAPTPESIDSQGEAVVDARSISTCDSWCNNAAPCVYERVFVDLDIDSDNNDGVALPQRTELEDCIEDRGECGQGCCCAGLLNPPGVFPGPKRIQPNTDDDDSDGRPDFAQDVGQPIAGESGELTPIVLAIRDPYAPHTDDPNTACVERPFGSYQLTYGDPARPGVIRLWRKGDRTGYVEPGVWYHDLQPYGDLNLDGFVTGYDISLFVLMLTNPASVPWNDPWVSAEEVADMNGDGFVTVADISIFVQTVSQLIPMRPIPKRFWVELLPLSSLAGNHVELTVQADYDAFTGDANGLVFYGQSPHCGDGATDNWIDWCCESFKTEGPSRDQVRLQAACRAAFDWDFAATTVDADTCLNDTQSRCWFPTLDEDNPDWIGGGAYHRPPGYPLQLDLAVGFGPPDLPPRSVDPWESSLALVPADARSSSGPSPYLQRETLRGVVDLSTGAPLLQDTDFELPFGGAVFRHIRTYSENVADSIHMHISEPNDLRSLNPEATHWGWNGLRWMMSENPILLIDAGWQGIVNHDSEGGRKRCYFIPDAHHAIPFDQAENGGYQAPAGYDARLSIEQGNYVVRLQRGALKYTFRPMSGDTWAYVRTVPNGPTEVVDSHEPPPAGHGIPKWARLERIEDRQGHVVEYEYCGDERIAHTVPNSDCVRCEQNCNQRGQLRLIRLRTPPPTVGGLGEVQWTLIYTHREFTPGDPLCCDASEGDCIGKQNPQPGSIGNDFCKNPALHRNKLHSIRVYRGAKTLPPEAGCLTIDDWRFRCRVSEGCENILDVGAPGDSPTTLSRYGQMIQSFDEYDQIDHEFFNQGGYDDWTHHVKYLYQERDGGSYDIAGDRYLEPCPPGSQYPGPDLPQYERAFFFDDSIPNAHANMAAAMVFPGQRLLKVSVSRKESSESLLSPTIPLDLTFYRYAYDGNNEETNHSNNHNGGIQAVFYNGTVQRVLRELRENPDSLPSAAEMDRCIASGPHTADQYTANEIFLCYPPDRVIWPFRTRRADGSEEVRKKSLGDIADLSFHSQYFQPQDRFASTRQVMEQSNVANLEHDQNLSNLGMAMGALHAFVDRRGGEEKKYALWFARRLQEKIVAGNFANNPGLFHTPYKQAQGPSMQGPGYLQLPSGQSFYLAVVDELVDEAQFTWGLMTTRPEAGGVSPYSPLAPPPQGGDPIAGIKERQVYETNPAGHLLSKRVYTANETEFTLQTSSGELETAVYANGKMVRRYSSGWQAAQNQGFGETLGLIHEFCYESLAGGCSNPARDGELTAIGVKQGNASADVYQLERYEREPGGRKDLIIKTARSGGNWIAGAPQPDDAEVTETLFDYAPLAQGQQPDERRVTRKRQVHPKARVARPGTSGPDGEFHIIEYELYDDSGRVTWKGIGLFASPTAQPIEFFASYTGFDQLGREIVRIVDANAAGLADYNSNLAWPGNLPHRTTFPNDDPLNPPQNLTTTTLHDDLWGPRKITYPNDRMTIIQYKLFAEEPQKVEQRIFKDVDPDGMIARSPGEINIIEDGSIAEKRTVHWTQPAPDYPGNNLLHEETYDLIQSVRPHRDLNGQVTSVTTEDGASGQEITSSRLFGAGGNIIRERMPDGSLARREYDFTGRLLKTWRGTVDSNEVYWGLPWPDSNQQTPEPDIPADNMFLAETRGYGDGIHDAGELTNVHEFRQYTTNRYWEFVPDSPHDEDLLPENDEEAPFGVPDDVNEDELGWPTYIQYDWRMRPVVNIKQAREYGASGGLTTASTSVTWLDNLDRPVFEATYGEVDLSTPGALGAVDPRTMQAGDLPPAAAEILATNPVSLQQMIYNKRGQVEETRDYRTGPIEKGQSAEYSSTYTYYGRGGKPVEVWSPNGPMIQYKYDAFGREIVASTFVHTGSDTIELTRTKTAYDNNGKPIFTESRERRHGTTGDLGAAGNGISTFSYSWYDEAGRVLATASLGTANAANEYVDGAALTPMSRPDSPATHLENASGYRKLTGCELPNTVPIFADAILTCYEYDVAGRQSVVWRTNGAGVQSNISQTIFDGLGRMRLSIESAVRDPVGATHDARVTAYDYDPQGRLLKIAALTSEYLAANGVPSAALPTGAWSNAGLQVTSFTYGADIVNDVYGAGYERVPPPAPVQGGQGVTTTDPTAVRTVTYPDGDTLTFNYLPNMAVADRIDGRGVRVIYDQDALGRPSLTRIVPANPLWLTDNGVARIQYTYNPLNQLERVEAWNNPSGTGSESLLSTNTFTYDPITRRLTSEQQQHHRQPNLWGQFDTNVDRTIHYTWQYGATGFHDYEHLETMQYPPRMDQAVGRTLTYQYGSATNAPEFVQGRITQLIDSQAGTLAGYAYGASQRLVQESRGGPIGSSILDYSLLGGSTSGYDTMDRFGRVRSHSWIDSAGGVNELLGVEVDFDALGNKRFARVRQLGHDNDRSYLFGYDDLQQLTFAELGRLNSENSSIVPDPLVTLRRRSRWTLDNLSNWRGENIGTQNEVPGFEREDFKLGNSSTETPDVSRTLTHAVDSANQITNVETDTVPTSGGSPVASDRQYVYDRAGNLVFDGDFVYFYDGLNHLVAVYERGSVTAGMIPNGVISDGSPIGLPVARFAYDGLGRLIKKNYRLGVAGESSALGFANYIYDGARRVQEILRYPVAAAALLWPAAADRPPLHAHPECAAGGGCPPGYATQHVIEHEYVWSPDGGDSIVAAITPDDLYGFDDDGPPAGAGLPSATGSGDDDVYYMLQDDNGNVMSVVDDAGAVRVQYQYDPYGELVIRDVPLSGSLPLPGPSARSPLFSVGFQGLFFERFYGLLVESAGGGQPSNAADPPLDVPAPVSASGGNGGSGGVGSASGSTQVRGLYYMRNRWYSAPDGRFTSRDPNEAGMPIIAALAANGETFETLFSPFSSDGHYSDGMNLYAFVNGNPVNTRDSLGLYSAEDEYEIDSLIGMHAGARVGALAAVGGKTGKRVNTGLMIAQVALSLIPGYDAVKLGVMLAFNPSDVSAMDYVAAAMSLGGGSIVGAGVKLIGAQVGRLVGKFGLRWLMKNGDDIVAPLARACAAARRCLGPGAPVQTAGGQKSIEEVAIGDLVLTRGEDSRGEPTCFRPVTARYQRLVPLITMLTLSNGATLAVTPDHPVWNETTGSWTPVSACAVGDELVDAGDQRLSVVALSFLATPTWVFNIEVDGTHTYFADGVWVHNCGLVWHHSIPMQIIRKLPDHVQDAINKSPKLLVRIPESLHKLLHGALGAGYRWSQRLLSPRGGGWNARWRAELHSLGKPLSKLTAEDLWPIRDRIMRDFGL